MFSLRQRALKSLCLVCGPLLGLASLPAPKANGFNDRGTKGTLPPLYEIHTIRRATMASQSFSRTTVNRLRSYPASEYSTGALLPPLLPLLPPLPRMVPRGRRISTNNAQLLEISQERNVPHQHKPHTQPPITLTPPRKRFNRYVERERERERESREERGCACAYKQATKQMMEGRNEWTHQEGQESMPRKCNWRESAVVVVDSVPRRNISRQRARSEICGLGAELQIIK